MNIQSVVMYDVTSADSVNASLIAREKLDESAEYIQIQRYTDPSAALYTKNNVYILGSTFSKSIMNEMMTKAKKVMWVDNHISITENWVEGHYPEGMPVVLSGGEIAWISPEDIHLIAMYSWHNNGNCRVKTCVGSRSTKNQRKEYMHYLILEKKEGLIVDHINRDTLDNRRQNLRYVTRGQNQSNSKTKNYSGYKGVIVEGSSFTAQITTNQKRIYLGSYNTKIEAAKVYDAAARKYHGQFARTNFDHQDPFPPTSHVVLNTKRSITSMTEEYFFPKRSIATQVATL